MSTFIDLKSPTYLITSTNITIVCIQLVSRTIITYTQRRKPAETISTYRISYYETSDEPTSSTSPQQQTLQIKRPTQQADHAIPSGLLPIQSMDLELKSRNRSTIEDSMSNIDDTLSSIDNTLSNMTNTLDRIDEKLTAMEERLTGKLDKMVEEIRGLVEVMVSDERDGGAENKDNGIEDAG